MQGVKSARRVLAETWAVLRTVPWLACPALAGEALQHFVEASLRMYTQGRGALTPHEHAVWLGFGILKVLGIVTTIGLVMRWRRRGRSNCDLESISRPDATGAVLVFLPVLYLVHLVLVRSAGRFQTEAAAMLAVDGLVIALMAVVIAVILLATDRSR